MLDEKWRKTIGMELPGLVGNNTCFLLCVPKGLTEQQLLSFDSVDRFKRQSLKPRLAQNAQSIELGHARVV